MTQHITQEQSITLARAIWGETAILPLANLHRFAQEAIQQYIDSIETSRERVEKDAGNVQVAQPASAPAAVSGWKLVPVEPTPAMLAAVVTSMDDFLLGKEAEKQYREDWAAMLAAAPTGEPG